MTNPPRKLAFILASTEHGAMIVNRFDEYRRPDNSGFGVGFQLLENAAYDPADVTLLLMLLDLRRRCYGDVERDQSARDPQRGRVPQAPENRAPEIRLDSLF
jgi:hypothetical protein